jgi:hypothetical protein
MFRISLPKTCGIAICASSAYPTRRSLPGRGMALRVARVEREACTDRIVIDYRAARRRQVERLNVCTDCVRLAGMPEYTQVVPPSIHGPDQWREALTSMSDVQDEELAALPGGTQGALERVRLAGARVRSHRPRGAAVERPSQSRSPGLWHGCSPRGRAPEAIRTSAGGDSAGFEGFVWCLCPQLFGSKDQTVESHFVTRRDGTVKTAGLVHDLVKTNAVKPREGSRTCVCHHRRRRLGIGGELAHIVGQRLRGQLPALPSGEPTSFEVPGVGMRAGGRRPGSANRALAIRLLPDPR